MKIRKNNIKLGEENHQRAIHRVYGNVIPAISEALKYIPGIEPDIMN